jgi:hypothetical protein
MVKDSQKTDTIKNLMENKLRFSAYYILRDSYTVSGVDIRINAYIQCKGKAVLEWCHEKTGVGRIYTKSYNRWVVQDTEGLVNLISYIKNNDVVVKNKDRYDVWKKIVSNYVGGNYVAAKDLIDNEWGPTK